MGMAWNKDFIIFIIIIYIYIGMGCLKKTRNFWEKKWL